MKKYIYLSFYLICLVCFMFFLPHNFLKKVHASVNDYIDIEFSSTVDITNYMENSNATFRFYNASPKFVSISLNVDNFIDVIYPAYSISILDSNYQIIKKCDIDDFDIQATNSTNFNSFKVFLPNVDYYYVEVYYDMVTVNQIELSINSIESMNYINLFEYNENEEFQIDLIENSNSCDSVAYIELLQSCKFSIEVSNSNLSSIGYYFIIIKLNSNKEEKFDVKINTYISEDTTITLNFNQGEYYICCLNQISSNNINLVMNRKISQYGSEYMVTDPDKYTNCGSQINVEEAELNIDSRSYRQRTITEGFTRLVYFNSYAPSTSREDYYWYSSDEDVATVSKYGTVLALPIDVYCKYVKIMAVYKYDMSKTFIKEFIVYNDSETYESDPIDIDIDLTIEVYENYTVEFNNTYVPYNMLQYYYWSGTTGISIDQFGRYTADDSAIGEQVITGVYKYNSKVKIKLNLKVILPLSGSELEYNPDLWSNSRVMYRCDCYSYAFNCQVMPGTNSLYEMSPGRGFDVTKDHFNKINSTMGSVVNAVIQDSESMGFMFVEIDKHTRCVSGTYKVALVVDNGKDYHWYRQNPDGTWSHKMGSGPVNCLDSESHIIYDPEKCCRSYFIRDTSYSYYDGIKFFQVTALNYMVNPDLPIELYTYNPNQLYFIHKKYKYDNE